VAQRAGVVVGVCLPFCHLKNEGAVKPPRPFGPPMALFQGGELLGSYLVNALLIRMS